MGRKSVEMPAYLFHQGTNFEAWRLLGAIPQHRGRYPGVTFRVWAPNAESVSVIGDWNGWDPSVHPMRRVTGDGVWERFIRDVPHLSAYKFSVTGQDGVVTERCDPYARHGETRPGNASKVWDAPAFTWSDGKWMTERKKQDTCQTPLSIYELHAGSWRTYPDGTPFDYVKLADELIPYLQETGFNCVELLPLTEYPLDESWGYQATGYFAPTSRYGTPDMLRTFVDRCHGAGIRVLLDWVPAHFPKNTDALARFDGSPCYEYRDPDKGEHKQWGTLVFDYGRNEVQSFLISSALYWLEQFHMDGLRVDAVASMLYLDYMRDPGEWKPNERGGNDHTEAVAFIQKLNRTVRERVPGALMIAEDSSDWAGLTDPDGLGFHYKWNMGWMNDLLRYFRTDPVYRGSIHDKLLFQLMYAFSEHYILPISHDEVVHLKRSLLQKMPGSPEQKRAGVRAFLGYMFAEPGKKLLFMGQEFGQETEWDYRRGLDWDTAGDEAHRKLTLLVSDLNRLYRATPALWNDGGWDGFRWLDEHNADGNVIVFRRIAKDGSDLTVLCNFSNLYYEGYRVGVSDCGRCVEVLNTDDLKYGGYGVWNGEMIPEDIPWQGMPKSVCLKVAPMSVIWMENEADLVVSTCRPTL